VTDTRPRIVVTAAVIRRGDEYFVTRRQRGVHLEGFWEFPGGKCDPGETLEACLRREIREELGADVIVGERILECSHEYPERIVNLHFFDCELAGDPSPMLGQEMRWVRRGDLRALQFPPADDELIGLLSC
jgi:8-oxo-dGTP diphosphatase